MRSTGCEKCRKQLTTISGADALVDVRGQLSIVGCPSLTSMNGLNAVEQIGGDLVKLKSIFPFHIALFLIFGLL